MSYWTDITTAISELDKWQRVALAAMCATGVSPIISYWGQPVTRSAFEDGLEAACNSVRCGKTNLKVLGSLDLMYNLPESHCDDSHLPAYHVMSALSVLAYTLEAIIEDGSAAGARDACTAISNHYGGYDHILTWGKQTRTINPRNPPPPGRLEGLVNEAQLRFAEEARLPAQSGDELVKRMQTLGRQLASELESILPNYSEKRGWRVKSP